MSKDVSIRKMEIFQTDDARRIEVWKKVGVAAFDPLMNEGEEMDEVSEDQMDEEELYVGVIQMAFPGVGPKEVRFRIDGVNNIQDAFSKYTEKAKEVADEADEKFREFMTQQQNKIVPASADTLSMLDEENGGGLIEYP